MIRLGLAWDFEKHFKDVFYAHQIVKFCGIKKSCFLKYWEIQTLKVL